MQGTVCLIRPVTREMVYARTIELGQEREAEFDARVLQGIKIPDLGLDGGEVGHGDFEF